jgi:hypothetical protein
MLKEKMFSSKLLRIIFFSEEFFSERGFEAYL